MLPSISQEKRTDIKTQQSATIILPANKGNSTTVVNKLKYEVKISRPNTSQALAGPSGIRARWGIETNGRFEAEKTLASAGPPLGG